MSSSTLDQTFAAAHSVSVLSQAFARVSFISASLRALLLLALHGLKPELAPSWRMVSEYANGRHGWMMALCFLGLSAGCVSLFIAIVPQVTSVIGRIGLAFLLMATIGLAMAAFYPTDPATTSAAEASHAGKMHGLSAMIGIPSFAVASVMISVGILAHPLWSPVRWPIIVFANLNWISVVLLAGIAMVLLPRHGGFGPQVPIGWPNRLLVIAWLGWLMAASWPMLTRRPPV